MVEATFACAFSKCLRSSPAIEPTREAFVRVAVPGKRLKRLSASTRQSLLITWDEYAHATFHAPCWAMLSTWLEALSSRGNAVSGNLLTASPRDVTLLKEVSDTAEHFEAPDVLAEKAKSIAALMRRSTHTVIFTGAGISAAAGIPTYRGVGGVDVVAAVGGPAAADAALCESAQVDQDQKKGKKRKKSKGVDSDPAMEQSDEYLRLRPTLTHIAIADWVARGLVHYVVTQNCDDLHHRAGVPTEKLVELHGNVFVEYCEECQKEYRRPYCVDLFSTDCSKEPWYRECPDCHFNHYTGRKCEIAGCQGKLRDTIVNFGDGLHACVLGGHRRAIQESERADLVLCLGSSLTVRPANKLPTLMHRAGTLAVCNLQATPLDQRAAWRVWAQTDDLVRMIDAELSSAEKKPSQHSGDT